jgi:hypothetical protein
MSWWMSILSIKRQVNSVEELTEEDIAPLGTIAEVVSVIRTMFPNADSADPTWIQAKWEGQHFEIRVGANDPLFSIGFRKPPLEALQYFCQQTGWQALDDSEGELFTFA